jgi:hypothetical protein
MVDKIRKSKSGVEKAVFRRKGGQITFLECGIFA